MASCKMRCTTCGEYIDKGKKFNARKETVPNEEYLGIKIFRFYIKCPRCLVEITFKCRIGAVIDVRDATPQHVVFWKALGDLIELEIYQKTKHPESFPKSEAEMVVERMRWFRFHGLSYVSQLEDFAGRIIIKMLEVDTCLQHEWNVTAWQAASVMFMKHFKEKLMLATNRTECPPVEPVKKLTTAAVYMIVVMTIFIIFAVLGSLNTAFEFLYEQDIQSKKLSKDTYNKGFAKKFSKKFTLIRRDWLKNSRTFLRCFCFLKNGKKLFQADSDKQQFECFHGIRVISNLGLICFHIGNNIIATRRNADKLKPFLLSPIPKFLFNAVFGVDAYFVLSGFLNAYSFSKEYDKNNGKICWWHFYLKRYLRLTPVYMTVFGFYTILLCYSGSGPIWPVYTINPVCKENWWRYLLYINNFQLSAKSCMVWCWHLATEMQVYFVSPIFLLSLLRWPRFGYSLASITIFLSGLYSFIISKQHNFIDCFATFDLYIDDIETLIDRFSIYVDKLYSKPSTRISSYLIGVLLGHYLYRNNFNDIRNRWITLCCGWIVAWILICISFFALLKREESVLETALYNSVKHQFFSVGLSWIIFVCLTKQGSFINSFLSWKLFFPFSKLSYCAFLIHMLIIERDLQAAQDLEEFSLLSSVLFGFRVYFWTFIISIPVSLLFEMPIITMFGLYIKKERFEKNEERKRN